MNPPDDCTFFVSGCNYQSYQGPDDCTFFFLGRNYEPAETSDLGTPPTIPTDGQTTEPFSSGRNYEPARHWYLFFFQVVIIIPTDSQMTVRFFFRS